MSLFLTCSAYFDCIPVCYLSDAETVLVCSLRDIRGDFTQFMYSKTS